MADFCASVQGGAAGDAGGVIVFCAGAMHEKATSSRAVPRRNPLRALRRRAWKRRVRKRRVRWRKVREVAEDRANPKIVITSKARDLLFRDLEGQQIPRCARDDNLLLRTAIGQPPPFRTTAVSHHPHSSHN